MSTAFSLPLTILLNLEFSSPSSCINDDNLFMALLILLCSELGVIAKRSSSISSISSFKLSSSFAASLLNLRRSDWIAGKSTLILISILVFCLTFTSDLPESLTKS